MNFLRLVAPGDVLVASPCNRTAPAAWAGMGCIEGLVDTSYFQPRSSSSANGAYAVAQIMIETSATPHATARSCGHPDISHS
jgi:hypothetical protein